MSSHLSPEGAECEENRQWRPTEMGNVASVEVEDKTPANAVNEPSSIESSSANSPSGRSGTTSGSHCGRATQLSFAERGESSKDAPAKRRGEHPAELQSGKESQRPFPDGEIERESGGCSAKETATTIRKSEGREQQSELLDDATARLVMQVQLEDARDLEQHSKGKEREGEISDADLARAIYEEDLAAMGQVLGDRRMARSIGIAVQNDGQLVASHRSEETHATDDRRLACRIGGQAAPSNSASGPDNQLDDEFVSRLGALYVGPAEKLMEDSAHVDDNSVECEICRDSVRQDTVANLPCGHAYCGNCLRELFRASFVDESLFPPKCCHQKIPVDTAEVFLTAEERDIVNQKELEFEITDKTYCSVPTCSTFIPSDKIVNDRAVCGACDTVTCSICKSEEHEDDCPKDTDTQQLLQMASEQGWQRCFNCKRMVELRFGCYHMTAWFCEVVIANPNFVTFVERNGRRAIVNSGMKGGFSLGQSRSWIVKLIIKHHGRNVLREYAKTCRPIAGMELDGGFFGAAANAKCASTICQRSF